MDKFGKVAIIFGTRPEIIKLSPIIRYCKNNNCDYFIIHTNQHYSANMDSIFIRELSLPRVKYNLNVGSGFHGKQTGIMLQRIEEVLLYEKPDVVLVQGDTNTVLAGALAASKLDIAVGHIEAGLRSFDRSMPEEINRVLTDHTADFLFCPTLKSQDFLLNEGIDKKNIFVTGNTIVDAIQYHTQLSEMNNAIFSRLNIEPRNYFVVTLHRPSNVDILERFQGVLDGLRSIYSRYKLPIIFPIHPRTKKMSEKFGLEFSQGLILTEPLGYLDFLCLLSRAKLILTDSGGIQEEACILGVPCVTLRENTERPETLIVGSNILTSGEPQDMCNAVDEMIERKFLWANPFGDGTAAEKIMTVLYSQLL